MIIEMDALYTCFPTYKCNDSSCVQQSSPEMVRRFEVKPIPFKFRKRKFDNSRQPHRCLRTKAVNEIVFRVLKLAVFPTWLKRYDEWNCATSNTERIEISFWRVFVMPTCHRRAIRLRLHPCQLSWANSQITNVFLSISNRFKFPKNKELFAWRKVRYDLYALFALRLSHAGA